MSKKKPYSKIENARHRRHEQMTYDRTMAKLKKAGVTLEPWQSRLVEEDHELSQKCYALKDFLWVTEREGDEDFTSYSPEALKLGKAYCRLLCRQYKAMIAYLGILDQRVSMLEFVGKGK